MKIAVTCENMEINGLVPKTFKDSEYLMIIDADKNQIFKIYGKQDSDNMVFELLAGAGVTRYNGSGHKVQTAYDKMNRYQLDWIADYIGGPGAFGHSHTGACECGEEE